ncbi:cyclic pyranopterin monophosphate synthase MoaC [Romboutsia sp. 1001713B170131_170501_G6]|uniref:cyclic pyranopterin monophosphate synthase MoaC n=1 Tax=Romboutsia sp. 1001713B170131_170501_G6 TaxID=2787108 RepID=UPI0018AA46C5|nr:cyclic pyranopterin monophosphate synthase MoaC [Romboutsia sp. 1001713B170131_170501_G6]
MLTHINEKGYAKMVDVGDKENTKRTATAKASILVSEEIINKILIGQVKKGDVLSVAQVAGIMGAKNTPMNIPMCHNINLVGCDLDFNIDKKENTINIYATCKSVGKTGVEMEALSAATMAALTIYDMCKAIDKKMVIKDVHLLEKSGGKSGNFKF